MIYIEIMIDNEFKQMLWFIQISVILPHYSLSVSDLKRQNASANVP